MDNLHQVNIKKAISEYAAVLGARISYASGDQKAVFSSLVTLFLVVILAPFLSGCTTAEKPDPVASAASEAARRDLAVAKYQWMASVKDPAAQVGIAAIDALADDKQWATDYGRYVDSVIAQNRAQGKVAGSLTAGLSKFSEWFGIAKIVDSAGVTSIENTTNGDNNDTAGRNQIADRSRPVDFGLNNAVGTPVEVLK